MMNSYLRKARLFPTILTSIPLLILVNKVASNLFFDTLRNINAVLPYLTGLGLSTALIYLLVQVNRFVAKELFQNLFFKEEMDMPTTIHLLWRDDFFDVSVKEKIRSKILQLYGMALVDVNSEGAFEEKAKKQIVSAVSQIRNSLRNNPIILQHNIEYGFFRNLTGGSVMAVLSSLMLLILGYYTGQKGTIITGYMLSAIYILPILLSKFLMKRLGKNYSKILYEQFLSI